jgi:hypothetical protein
VGWAGHATNAGDAGRQDGGLYVREQGAHGFQGNARLDAQ